MENRVVLFGRAKEIKDNDFIVSLKDVEVPIFLSKDFKDYVSNIMSKGGNYYALVNGFLATLPEYTYVYPYNLVITKEEQRESNVVIFSGKVSDVYTYENRLRLFVRSERKDKITKMFVTVFKSDFPNLTVPVGSDVIVVGRLTASTSNPQNPFITANEIFVRGHINESIDIGGDADVESDDLFNLNSDEIVF
jgi:hypothetical protein